MERQDKMKITIAHLYPDLLNLYGDRGNITSLVYRLKKRGIEAVVNEYELSDNINFEDTDIIFIGGGSDREQLLVCNRLREFKDEINNYADRGGCIVAVCGGYQLLGKYYKLENETVPGIELLDIYTEQGSGRLIGNIVLESELTGDKIVGFENHGGRTYINSHKPLGKVVYGFGNNDSHDYEGVVWKNVIGTYLHGTLFPKNPKLADYVIQKAIERRYGDFELVPLDDKIEYMAHDYIVNKYHD